MSAYVEAKNIGELCEVLGLPASQAPKAAIRRDLVIAITGVVEKRHLTHATAAKEAKVGRTVITAVINGNIKSVSTDRLIDIAHALGLTVSMKVTARPSPARGRAHHAAPVAAKGR